MAPTLPPMRRQVDAGVLVVLVLAELDEADSLEVLDEDDSLEVLDDDDSLELDPLGMVDDDEPRLSVL